MTKLPRIIFMGTAEFSIPPLRALHGAGFEIAAVYTKPPRHSGRGQREHRSPIHREADGLGLPVFTAPKLSVPEVGAHIESLHVDIGVVIAYGLLIPKNILGMPSFGFLNIHASLLPRWRGAAPIQRAIMAGDKESGVSIIEMDEGLDTGAVLLEKACPIFENETFSHLYSRLADMGAELILPAIAGVCDKSLTARPQEESLAVYAHKIDKKEARLDWGLSAKELHRRICGLSPFPGAWFLLGSHGKKIRVKIIEAECVEGAGKAGEVLSGELDIACGEGALRLISLQREGKKIVSAEEFQRGLSLDIGEILE